MLHNVDNIHLVIHSSLFIQWCSFCQRRTNQVDANKYNVDDFTQAEVSVWEIISVFYRCNLSLPYMASISLCCGYQKTKWQAPILGCFPSLGSQRVNLNQHKKIVDVQISSSVLAHDFLYVTQTAQGKERVLCGGGCIPTFSSSISAILSLGKGQATPEEQKKIRKIKTKVLVWETKIKPWVLHIQERTSSKRQLSLCKPLT